MVPGASELGASEVGTLVALDSVGVETAMETVVVGLEIETVDFKLGVALPTVGAMLETTVKFRCQFYLSRTGRCAIADSRE